ncbi:MAG: hypothetical protein M3Q60_18305 [Actinomycetota bacterium]|nr:hypothetical protein [Actinomycetota bacterium]
MGESKVGERHMRFLEVLDEVALGDISGVASVYRCAERLGLDFVGKEADREEIVGLVRDLQEAGYAKIAAGVREVNAERLALGGISLTEDGRSRIQAS